MDCPARGQVGQGNIGIHSQKRQRYWCKVCRKPFSARAGTIFYRRRTDEDPKGFAALGLGRSARLYRAFST